MIEYFYYNGLTGIIIKIFSEVPCCQYPGCIEPGTPCEIQGDREPDSPIYEYFCNEHKEDEGYCAGCGIFIAGIGIDRYCDNCRQEIDYNDREDFNDEDDLYDGYPF